jgi:two-component system phosphate regulon sensor histidine kinase PhoR
MQLLAGIWAILLAALVVPFIIYDRTVGADILAETEKRAVRNLGLVAWLVQHLDGPMGQRDVDDWFTELGDKLGVRISFIRDGRVLADSRVAFRNLATLEDHSGRAEVQEAVRGRLGLNVRHSATLGYRLLYAARSVPASKVLPAGVLRVALPLSEVEEQRETIRATFLAAMLATLALTAGFGLLLSGRLSGAMTRFAETARAIGQGEFARRVRFTPGRELEPLAQAINTMAAGVDRAVADLTDEKARMEAMLDGMAEGVLVLDQRGRISSWNRAFAVLFPGVARFRGRSVLEATMEPELQWAVESVTRGKTGAEHIQVHVGGRHLDVSVVSCRMPEESRAVLVFHDISQVKRMEQVRRDFVANVSHELRTPVASIKGYAETLRESPPAEEDMRRKFLSIIERNADHMTSMLEKLLRLARFEYTGGEAAVVAVEAGSAAEEALAMVLPLAENGEVELENRIPDGLEVLAAPEGLREIFVNLAENAVRYAPAKSRVVLDGWAEDGAAVFVVRDQGPGIPQESLKRVFERFYRVEGGGKAGSSGIGLAICRNLVRRFGGDIWAESPVTDEGRGAALNFRLRLASAGRREGKA